MKQPRERARMATMLAIASLAPLTPLAATLVGGSMIGFAQGCHSRADHPPPPAAAAAAAAAAAVADAATTALTDELGRIVVPRTLPAHRLISLAPNITELLFAIGAGNKLVGIDAFSDRPTPEVGRIARVGSNYEPSLERILELRPDLVISSSTANRRETVEALDRLGVPTFVTDTRRLGDMDRTVRNLGGIAGHTRQADNHLDRLHRELAALSDRVAREPTGERTTDGTSGKPSAPRVVVVVWNDPLYVAGRDTFIDDLIRAAGGSNVTDDVTGFARYPLEKLLNARPDVIVLPSHAPEVDGPQRTAFWSRFTTLPAVSRRRVHAVEDSLIIRPGARLAEGARLLATLFHPTAAAK